MIKKIILNIKSFLLAISFFILIILVLLSNTIFNKNYLLNKFDKINFYEETYHNINDNLKGYVIQSGLDTNVLEKIITKEKVNEDIKKVIDSLYENKELNIQIDEIKENLELVINNQIKENNRVMSKEDKQAIQSFIDTILNTYKDEIVFSSDLFLKVQDIYVKLDKIISISIPIFIVISLVLVLTIIKISKNKKISIKKISTSLLTTSMLLIFIRIILANKFQYILIINAIFSKTLIFVITDILNKVLLIGIIISIFALIITILISSKNTVEN